MKKLLSILGAITLIGTASTSVIACNGGEKPTPPTPDKTNIAGIIPSTIDLGELSANTAAGFKTKLQEKLANLTELSSIKTEDYDVYKAGTEIAIMDSDITGKSSLKIKIVARGAHFEGEKDDITTNYTKHATVEMFANLGSDTTRNIAFDSKGNLYSSTVGSKIYKIDSNGIASLFADLVTDNSYMLAFDSEDNVYSSTVRGGNIYKITPN